MVVSWKLLELRARISRIDTQLVALLAQRFAAARDVQKLKTILQLPREDSAREAEVLRQVSGLAADLGLDARLLRSIWLQLFAVSKAGLTSVKEAEPVSRNNSAPGRSIGGREVCDD